MTRGKNTKRRPWPPKKADLEALIEEAIVDAYGESEQRTGFYTMIEEHRSRPRSSALRQPSSGST